MTTPSLTGPARAGLALDQLHGALADPALASMNFLNEVSAHYPDAISFAAGRPVEDFFSLGDVHRYLDVFAAHLAERGMADDQVRRTLLQYGPTKGIIGGLVAEHLRVDEGIDVPAESVVVTAGCQEAMLLTVRALRADERDVLLAVAPHYVGITGAARLVDLPVLPVDTGIDGIDLGHLAQVVQAARAAGKRPRACYLVPDFANPTGASLSVEHRRRLLDLADELDLLLVEDNPYGLFGDDDRRPPTLKALDEHARVLYLGSFAKTGLPGARIGYVVADQPVSGAGLLADELAKIKSMVTVNTSPLAQAVIGGKLLVNGMSLVRANRRETEHYRRNRARLLDGLERRLGSVPGVRWTAPAGGFFVVVDVPFEADDDALARSASEYGVLWTPMRHFYPDHGGERQLRLSCSALHPPEIETGLDRLAALIHDRSTHV